ncbi:MAG: hypothetical protein LBQ68_03805, partial [Clostridiales bacterium]|nr:hypothetical protein [Clostridiales bacterium]
MDNSAYSVSSAPAVKTVPAAKTAPAAKIRLPAFEGAFDLLLHLIEKNQINIYDIPIAELTEQYI